MKLNSECIAKELAIYQK